MPRLRLEALSYVQNYRKIWVSVSWPVVWPAIDHISGNKIGRFSNNNNNNNNNNNRVADKSLARPGRKQATATKLGNYWTYSPRSSIHFLARCSNFCKTLKKIIKLSVQPGIRATNDLCVGRKKRPFNYFFQSREQVVVRRGQIRRIGWVIKTMEAEVGQFLLGCKCPVSRGIVV